MPNSRFFRYLIAGGTAYVVEMATLYSLRIGLELSPVRSVAVSFWAGFLVAFTLQKLITFRNYVRHARGLARQIIGYSLLVLWNYVFTLLMVRLWSGLASVFVIRTLVIIVIMSWNFAAYRILFKKPVGEDVN